MAERKGRARLLEGGRFTEGGDDKVFLSTKCNLILANSWIEKQKPRHYTRTRKVKINIFRLLKRKVTQLFAKTDRKEAKYDDNAIETYKWSMCMALTV